MGQEPVAAAALERGLVVNAVTPRALRLAPPLLVSDEEMDAAVEILRDLLSHEAALHRAANATDGETSR